MKKYEDDDLFYNQYYSLSGGYGFAAFCYLLAFLVTTIASIYYSPFLCGTDKEKRMLKSPEEVGDGYSMYNEGAGGAYTGSQA